jgi:hypothetical protein
MGPGFVGIRVHVLPLDLNYHISFVKNSHLFPGGFITPANKQLPLEPISAPPIRAMAALKIFYCRRNNNPSGHFRQQAAASDSALFLVKDAV